MNRALSIRSGKSKDTKSSSTGGLSGSLSQASTTARKGFSLSSLRGRVQPELSKKLYKLIKQDNLLIAAHETAGKERKEIASQLSDWGESSNDDAVSDLSDKIGVILSEIGEQEENYSHALDESRNILKAIRNTEKSVQPSRDHKDKILDEIAKIKNKEPESTKLVTLEQELVRAEAENLVAEAQLSNVTRTKFKEAWDVEFLATIERAEKQIILAKHGRRLVQLLDDSAVTPGDDSKTVLDVAQARQILNDAEEDLREWTAEEDYTKSNAELNPADPATGIGSAGEGSHLHSLNLDEATKPNDTIVGQGHLAHTSSTTAHVGTTGTAADGYQSPQQLEGNAAGHESTKHVSIEEPATVA